MAQFTIYTSDDTDAPVLNGISGSLCRILSASLLTGYGSKAAAGWTCPFSSSNKMVFRQGGGNQFYLRVEDSGSGIGFTKEARLRGYTSMTDIDTGSGEFPWGINSPTASIISRKSTATSSVARPWVLAADDRTFYLFVNSGDYVPTRYWGTAFGDFYSFLPNDGYRTLISGKVLENNAAGSDCPLDKYVEFLYDPPNTGEYMARGHYGIGNAVPFVKTGDNAKSGASLISTGYIPFTNPSNGGIFLSYMWISDRTTSPAYGIRGRFRGLYQWLHFIGDIADRDTFAGTGEFAGKTFMLLKTSTSSGSYVIETSNTLETN